MKNIKNGGILPSNAVAGILSFGLMTVVQLAAQSSYTLVDLTATASGAATSASGGQAAGYTSSVPNAFTRAMTVSGMGITSQLRRVIFFPVFRAMNLYPPWRLPLGPSEMAPLVLGF